MKSREGKIKRAGAVMSFFAVGCTSFSVSCTGLDRHLHNTINPFGNPNTPDARSETTQRIQGAKASTMPLLPEEGDVWPGQPEPVPSLQDVSRSDAHFVAKWEKARPQLDADLRQQLNDGQGISVGEDVGKRYGSGRDVMPIGQPIPSHVKDNAPPYMEPTNKGVVTIPNGDGTDTLIAPDGSVKIVSAGKASLYKNARTFGHNHPSEEQTQETQAEVEKAPAAEPQPSVQKEPVVTEVPRPQPKVERPPEPQPPVHEAPPAREVPHPQPKVEAPHEVQKHIVHEAPPAREVPHPQRPEAHVVIPPPVVPSAPIVPEPSPKQPDVETPPAKHHSKKHKDKAAAESAPRHKYDEAAVDAAQPVVESSHAHKPQHHKPVREHEAVAATGRHHKASQRPTEAPAKKERHHTHQKKHDGEFVDALGLETSPRSHRSHKSDGVYQFDWDK